MLAAALAELDWHDQSNSSVTLLEDLLWHWRAELVFFVRGTIESPPVFFIRGTIENSVRALVFAGENRSFLANSDLVGFFHSGLI